MNWRQRILAVFRFIESGGANRILHRSTTTPHPPGEMAVTNGDTERNPHWPDK